MRDLVVATLKAGTGQATVFFCAIVSVKVLALMTGPAGVGLFSLLRQIQQTLCVIASVGGQNAVVQGVASRQGLERAQFVTSVLHLVLAGASIVGLGTLLLSSSIAALVFGSESSRSALVQWILVPVILGALLIFLRALLNASMRIGAVAWVNISTGFGGLLMVVPAATAYRAGHEDALILILSGSLGLGLITAGYHAIRHDCLYTRIAEAPRFERSAAHNFLSVAIPSLMALFLGMGCILAVRTAIVRSHGLPLAGQFDAAWSISVTFLVLFLTSIQTYLLPKLSASTRQAEWQDVMERALRLSAIIAVPSIASLIVLKPVAVRVFYSVDFIDAVELLRWTLLGDYIRVAGWVLATTLVAKADMRAYLACEVAWNVLFATFALWMVPAGIEGAGPAYVGAYGLYLALLVIRICGHHRLRIHARPIAVWSAGFGIIVLATLLAWNDTTLVWSHAAVIPLAALFSWAIMSTTEKRFVLDAYRLCLKRMRG